MSSLCPVLSPDLSRLVRGAVCFLFAIIFFGIVPSVVLGAETLPVLQADVCVVGGGSGGFATALAAARAGAKVIVVEREPILGGTSTSALVSNWEPGPGCEFARELFDRLQKTPGSIGVTQNNNPGHKKGPFGLFMVDPKLPYDQSLRRAGVPHARLHSVAFDPQAMAQAMQKMLEETGRVTLLLNTSFVEAKAVESTGDDGKTVRKVEAIEVENSQAVRQTIRAKIFVDSTGCVALCRALGCETMLGADPKSRFAEPSAPEEPQKVLNAISLCYAIRPSKTPLLQEKPEPMPSFARTAHVTGWPEGKLIVNPLPILPGIDLIDRGYDACMEAGRRAIVAHWNWLQSVEPFSGYEFDSAAPMLGVRESYRVVTEYVLAQHDLVDGLERQKHSDLIAVVDHPCDVHGQGGHLGRVEGAYGVPYRCLIPSGGWANLLVACRGAGFSKIAASSCRLSRTMIQLGHAAGEAAVLAIEDDVPVGQIDIESLTKKLKVRDRYLKTKTKGN
jgi:NAD(P)-dependent dehydrogenase (short-subunit alcohol dehydrogenase family)